MNKKAVHLIAYGRVQGVGFRFFVRETASAYGVKGWVRNLSNGNVEVQAEGESGILKDFVDRIRRGPTFGRVDELTEEWMEATNDFSAFSIEF